MGMDLTPELDRQKLKAVVHYICNSCDPGNLGNVKLHKILYFADMLTYLGTGSALTGVRYVKQQFGPVATHLTSALDELARDGSIEIRTRDYYGFKKKDYVVLRPPSNSGLSNAEVVLIEDMISFVCAKSAREISELSHNVAWETADLGETIPYFTVHGWMPETITEADVDFAVSEARRIEPSITGGRDAAHFQ